MLVGELEPDLPVLPAHRMLAGPDVVAQRTVDELVHRREALRLQAAGAKEAVDGVGGLQFTWNVRLVLRFVFAVAAAAGIVEGAHRFG